ncbi:hypothetical protein NOCA2390016 [metagenome]|uniref:D-alanine--D-alanine ligase N-terminal domain-containing protein n=1 Tax=metagenome TaxID=256318 RepID=A0A2P2C523_9ZZZZ
MSRLRVAVVGGGQNCEHQVSLASAASVAAALDPGRYDVVRLTIDPDGEWWHAAGAGQSDGHGGVVSPTGTGVSSGWPGRWG